MTKPTKDCTDCIHLKEWSDSNYECSKYENMDKNDPYKNTLGLLLMHNYLLSATWCKLFTNKSN